jgi:hypothetical protein
MPGWWDPAVKAAAGRLAPRLYWPGPMLVYRSAERQASTAAALDSLIRTAESASHPTHDALTEIFIDLGEIESAIADRLFPHRDGLHPIATVFRNAALRSAHALIASWSSERATRDRELARMLEHLRRLPRAALPETVDLRVSEGYAYYALHPESYAAAAAQFAEMCRPSLAICVGIRSIGASLSAIVAAALERRGISVRQYTVRPRGHPFDRRVDVHDDLAAAWRAAPSGAHFLVVDEGPGLSGSSFGAVVRALESLRVDPRRVSLFPSWNPDGSAFRSVEARAVWTDHRRFCADGKVARCSIVRRNEGIDLSAGAWRGFVCADPSSWPAVQPQHERVKRLLPASDAIVRFAGLGRYGAIKRQRANALAERGLAPRPLDLENGYLSMPFIDGKPCVRPTTALIDAAAAHVAFLTRTFPADRSPGVDALMEMTASNLREGLGDAAPPLQLEPYRRPLEDAPCAAIDGRMLAHEWLESHGAFVKDDALDHHCDHFFPGVQDAGWDLAAVAFEFGLDRSGRERLIEKYRASSGDRDIQARLPFYDMAYPAFRLGYAALAQETLGETSDGRRFRAVAERCRARLRQVLTSPSAL